MDWEFQVLYALQRIHNPLLDKLMAALSMLGNAGLLWICAGILLLFFKRWRRGGLQMLLSMALTFLIGNLILKTLVARERPCWVDPGVALLVNNPTDYSFPSGHTMNGFTSAVSLWFIDRRMGIPALILASAIAFSRLYNFVHYPTDVLAGIVVGTGAAVFVNFLFQRSGRKGQGAA